MPSRVKTIAEIGINHNGDIDTAKRLIDVAVSAGVDYVKFQKRTPDLCVPEDQKNVIRDTPWGRMTYLEYKYRMEFGKKEYEKISRYCKGRIGWFASVWDMPSLDFISQFDDCAFIKIPSAMITDTKLLTACNDSNKGVIISTGMSDEDIIDNAWTHLNNIECMMHTTSTYPAKSDELNLQCIKTLQELYGDIIGYSNHHPGLIAMVLAASMGATMLEFHITLDRSMWGTDHSASIEPEGIYKLIKYLKTAEMALGDGVKRIYESELPIMAKLRGAA